MAVLGLASLLGLSSVAFVQTHDEVAFDLLSSAKTQTTNLVSAYEERELDALLGANNLLRLSGKLEDLRSELSSGETRAKRAREKLTNLEKAYATLLSAYEARLPQYCYSPKFADWVGDVLDAVLTHIFSFVFRVEASCILRFLFATNTAT